MKLPNLYKSVNIFIRGGLLCFATSDDVNLIYKQQMGERTLKFSSEITCNVIYFCLDTNLTVGLLHHQVEKKKKSPKVVGIPSVESPGL